MSPLGAAAGGFVNLEAVALPFLPTAQAMRFVGVAIIGGCGTFLSYQALLLFNVSHLISLTMGVSELRVESRAMAKSGEGVQRAFANDRRCFAPKGSQ